MRREIFNRTFVIVCALLLAACLPALAQARPQGATLSGRVTDPQGAGLPGASVTLHERARTQVRLSTVTDASGAYRFERLAPGEYIVEAEAPGFASAAAQAVNVSRDSRAALDLRLEVAGVSTEVVVTAADAPQTVDEVSKAVTTVTAREMEERDEATIADALRTVAGLRVQQLGGPGSLVSIKTRGLRNQDTSLLIDGQRFRDPLGSSGRRRRALHVSFHRQALGLPTRRPRAFSFGVAPFRRTPPPGTLSTADPLFRRARPPPRPPREVF